MQTTLSQNALLDNEQESKSVILAKIIWSVAIIITLSFVIASVLQPEYIYRYCLIIALVCAVSLISLRATRRGYAKITAIFYISFLLVMIFIFSWTGGGIKGHGMKILPIIVLFAGLTLGKKEIWIFCGVATLGGFMFVMADYFNLLPVKDPLGNSPTINWIYTTTSIFLLCFFENLSVEKLRQALRKCEAELELRTQSEEALKVKNKKLREIAFLQSHEVRRPVASVLGLINLIKFNNVNDPLNLELIPKLEIAAKDLDAIIHQIVAKTSEIEALLGIETK